MDQILDLSTKIVRPQIKVDDVNYDLMLPTDMALQDVLWLQKAGGHIDQLQKKLAKEDYNEAVAEELERTLHRFAGLILKAVPEEVRAKLTDTQLMAVVDAYGKYSKKTDRFFDGRVGRPNGQMSSRNSSGSTEGRSKTG